MPLPFGGNQFDYAAFIIQFWKAPTMYSLRSAEKTDICKQQKYIFRQWSKSSLSAWRKLGSLATHWAHSEDSDQTGWMPRLIWVFAGRTLTLLVLSRGGSYFVIFCDKRHSYTVCIFHNFSTRQEVCLSTAEFILSYSVGLGSSNMRRCIYDKWCRSAGGGSWFDSYKAFIKWPISRYRYCNLISLYAERA